MAQRHGLKGWVCNDVDGVHIEINAEADEAKRFSTAVAEEAPPMALITDSTVNEIPYTPYGQFEIRKSSPGTQPELLLTPDFGICNACAAELVSTDSRRFHYPFTTCTQCGPRYSIITGLPYDRERTTMKKFVMCETCGKEYEDIDDRRYFSQTNSCPDCAIRLWLTDHQGKRISTHPDEAISLSARFIFEGKIIAVKGIGGYLLMCDARNETAIETLRDRKHRPSKPFALMYPSLTLLQEHCHLSEEEIKAFGSVEAPIVLVQMKPEKINAIAFDAIAPKLSRIGVMNPYTPLFRLLMDRLKIPVVATSGNVSGSPIYFDNDAAFENLKNLADYFLMNDRDIVVPQDDSVMQFTKNSNQKIILRRSRGLAPSLLHHAWETFDEEILCTGADLKSAFALHHAGNTYVSQFLGDLENFDSQQSYREVMNHLLGLLKMKPAVVIRDLHPQYFSSMLAEEFARKNNLPVVSVQHHEAHFASVLAENELLHPKEKILGVIWDGVGFRDDGSIRGGELFLFEKGKITHASSIESFPYVLGDKMSREPRLSALSLTAGIPEAASILRLQFSEQEWNFYQKLLKNEKHPPSTSMGRLFDAVSALLGITSINTFEGEAAMHLENMADSANNQRWNPYELDLIDRIVFPTSALIRKVVDGINRKTPQREPALRFHQTLVEWIEQAAHYFEVKHVAFSGGVFQNALLVDLIIERMKNHFRLHFHRQLAPNDECISFGQLAAYYLRIKTN
jgi:hydrogenase maturation protein HypF